MLSCLSPLKIIANFLKIASFKCKSSSVNHQAFSFTYCNVWNKNTFLFKHHQKKKKVTSSAYKLSALSSLHRFLTHRPGRATHAQSLVMEDESYSALILVKTPMSLVLFFFFFFFLQYTRFLQAKAIKRVIRMLKTDVNKGNETVVRDEASRSHTLIKNPVGSK